MFLAVKIDGKLAHPKLILADGPNARNALYHGMKAFLSAGDAAKAEIVTVSVEEALPLLFGLAITDVKTAKDLKAVDIKFANPADPNQTWTGRGRQPNWLKGKDPEKFRV